HSPAISASLQTRREDSNHSSPEPVLLRVPERLIHRRSAQPAPPRQRPKRTWRSARTFTMLPETKSTHQSKPMDMKARRERRTASLVVQIAAECVITVLRQRASSFVPTVSWKADSLRHISARTLLKWRIPDIPQSSSQQHGPTRRRYCCSRDWSSTMMTGIRLPTMLVLGQESSAWSNSCSCQSKIAMSRSGQNSSVLYNTTASHSRKPTTQFSASSPSLLPLWTLRWPQRLHNLLSKP